VDRAVIEQALGGDVQPDLKQGAMNLGGHKGVEAEGGQRLGRADRADRNVEYLSDRVPDSIPDLIVASA